MSAPTLETVIGTAGLGGEILDRLHYTAVTRLLCASRGFFVMLTTHSYWSDALHNIAKIQRSLPGWNGNEAPRIIELDVRNALKKPGTSRTGLRQLLGMGTGSAAPKHPKDTHHVAGNVHCFYIFRQWHFMRTHPQISLSRLTLDTTITEGFYKDVGVPQNERKLTFENIRDSLFVVDQYGLVVNYSQSFMNQLGNLVDTTAARPSWKANIPNWRYKHEMRALLGFLHRARRACRAAWPDQYTSYETTSNDISSKEFVIGDDPEVLACAARIVSGTLMATDLPTVRLYNYCRQRQLTYERLGALRSFFSPAKLRPVLRDPVGRLVPGTTLDSFRHLRFFIDYLRRDMAS